MREWHDSPVAQAISSTTARQRDQLRERTGLSIGAIKAIAPKGTAPWLRAIVCDVLRVPESELYPPWRPGGGE